MGSEVSKSSKSSSSGGICQKTIKSQFEEMEHWGVKFEKIWYGTYRLEEAAAFANKSPLGNLMRHHYIIIEYGPQPKIHALNNEFEHKWYIRIDFGFDGYGFYKGETIDYWTDFKREKDDLDAQFMRDHKCVGDATSVLNALKEHNTKYNVKTNNCQDFAELIWDAMTTVN